METSTVLDRTITTIPLPMFDSPYLTRPAVAELLKVSTRTVDRLKGSGQLGYVRVKGGIRFSLLDVARFLAKNEVSCIA
jgi:excisionase family DNA binding protein